MLTHTHTHGTAVQTLPSQKTRTHAGMQGPELTEHTGDPLSGNKAVLVIKLLLIRHNGYI